MDIRLDIGAMKIRERSLLWISVVARIIRHGHPWFLRISKRISARTSKRISARTVRPGRRVSFISQKWITINRDIITGPLRGKSYLKARWSRPHVKWHSAQLQHRNNPAALHFARNKWSSFCVNVSADAAAFCNLQSINPTRRALI